MGGADEMNLPNKLTLIRIAMIPVFIACFYIPYSWWNYCASAIFLIAYITDIIDGNYARKHGIVTDFGKLMDPIADKLLTSSALIMLTGRGMLSPIPAFIIIAREFIISGFRMVSAGKGNIISANWIGKVKTVLQCVALLLIMLVNPIFSALGIPLDKIVLWLSVVLAVWSAGDYIIKNKSALNFN